MNKAFLQMLKVWLTEDNDADRAGSVAGNGGPEIIA